MDLSARVVGLCFVMEEGTGSCVFGVERKGVLVFLGAAGVGGSVAGDWSADSKAEEEGAGRGGGLS